MAPANDAHQPERPLADLHSSESAGFHRLETKQSEECQSSLCSENNPTTPGKAQRRRTSRTAFEGFPNSCDSRHALSPLDIQQVFCDSSKSGCGASILPGVTCSVSGKVAANLSDSDELDSAKIPCSPLDYLASISDLKLCLHSRQETEATISQLPKPQQTLPSGPPPPPPPPPGPPPKQQRIYTSNIPPPPPVTSAHSLWSHPGLTERRVRKFIDILDEFRSDAFKHRELREEALTQRNNLKNMRKELQKHRLAAQNMEARLVTELRQICLRAKLPDYKDLFQLYEDVGNARDVLGPLEDDFEEQERRYDVLELRVSREECDLVGNLMEDVEDLQIVTENGELDSELSIPFTRNEIQNRLDDFDISQPQPPVDVEDPEYYFPEPSADSEKWDCPPGFAAIQDIDQSDQFSDYLSEVVDFDDRILGLVGNIRRTSEPTQSTASRSLAPKESRRPRSESDLGVLQCRWPSTRAHVDQWILDSVKASDFEKAIAKAQTEKEIADAIRGSKLIDRKTWWHLFKQSWSLLDIDESQ